MEVFMKSIYSPLPQETVSVSIEFSPVWEIILGIAGYTHSKLRHTFELDGKWTENQSSMSTVSSAQTSVTHSPYK